MSQKAKMCKSPKNILYTQSDKIEYENLNTNCTIVGSNNLHLVKKPQIVTTGLSPAYSNPSPGYPQSPYSSPASLKSPSPQSMKPPTPQPNTYPVMQIIHNSHPVLARPIHTSQPQNVIKLKPPLNILPKPSASPQQSPKPSVSPQIVLPANQQATIMPTAQPLLLNQMPMLAPGVQFILRPQTAKLPAQMQQTPQGLILQQGGQQLLQLQPPRSQPMVRVLTNGVGLPTTTYVTHMAPQNNIQQAPPPQVHSQPSQSPKKKPNKKKKQKLDLANIMKLSGIGDDDDVQFESDASQSESEHNAHSQPVTPQPQQPTTPTILQPQVIQQQTSMGQSNDGKGGPKMGNIQISAMPQAISTAGTPLMQVLNQSFQGGAQTQQAQPQGIPFTPFMTPNFTINNGLMVQRSGGFKLALGEDGRLVLQHDPTLNQDLNSQLLLQSLFGLNGGLVLQPSIDQQIHSQTVQTIQQQSVQTIQQQTVQSQTIQTVQHQIVQPQTIQSIQSQIQGQIQSLLQQQNLGQQSIAIQPQNITIQPQGLQSIQVSQPLSIHQPITIHSQSQPITIQAQSQQPSTIQSQSHPIQSHNHNNVSQPISLQSAQPITMQSSIAPQSQIINISQANQIFANSQLHNTHNTQPPVTTQPTFNNVSPAVTLSSNLGNQPVLKVQPFQKTQPPVQTVHPIHHHNSQPQHQPTQPPPTSYVVNLTPDQLEQLKRNGQLTVNGQTIFMQRPNKSDDKKTSPKIKPIKKSVSKIPTVVKENKTANNLEKTINHVIKESVKPNIVQPKCSPVVTQAVVQSQVKTQPSAIIQPIQPSPVIQPKLVQTKVPEVAPNNQEVERFLGQLIEETQAPPPPVPPAPPVTTQAIQPSNIVITTNTTVPIPTNPTQRVHTIQLTPQKQQHLKSIQLQIQTLSARLTPGNTEMQNALKLLFQEQQKILASGKLLPPDKVFYHNNQLIVNNSVALVKNEVQSRPTVTSAVNGPVENITPVLAPNVVVSTPSIVPPKITMSTTSPEVIQNTTVPQVPKVVPAIPIVTTAPQPPPTRFIPLYTKAQLIEQQMNTDQNGAIKPDIQAPFKDKADACKRLIRYHCFEQPVLSSKDLGKADEIFELTARHFIDKFGRMVDKYRYLLHKESQRHVQTSELMMLDRMFLAEEQQSLIKLRQEIDDCNLEMQQQQQRVQQQETQQDTQSVEEYDEWACIQRELGCLPLNEDNKMPNTSTATLTTTTNTTSTVNTTTTMTTSVMSCSPSVKRACNSDSRLETLKKFRVDKHGKKPEEIRRSTTTTPSASHFVQSTNTIVQQSSSGSTNYHTSEVQRSSFQTNRIIGSSNGPSCTITSNPTPVPNPINTSHMMHYNSTMHIQQNNPMQRMHLHQNMHSLQHVVHNSHQQAALLQRGNMQHYTSQHIVQHITHTVHGVQNSVHHSSSVHSQNSYSSGNEELDNNDSIDEQVQSAIDSILNLQQSTSLELDETMQNMLS